VTPASPAQSAFSRDDEQTPVKTLDYLGLADTPTPPRGIRGPSSNPTVLGNVPETNGLPTHREFPTHHETEPLPGYLSAASRLRDVSRIRSYSVADKDKYDEDHAEYEYEDEEDPQVLSHPTFLPEVQTTPKSAYSNLFLDSHSPRPRASTTGVLNSPPSLTAELFVPPFHARMDTSKLNPRGIQQYTESQSQTSQSTVPRPISSRDVIDAQGYYAYSTSTTEDISSQPSRALWLATVPQGITQQHLETIFSQYGAIESSRVLTHKNCGFVNFVSIDDAIAARSALAGRELFPGAGGVKIGFAKVPAGIVLSPSPEPLLMASSTTSSDATHLSTQQRLDGSRSRSPVLPPLAQIHPEILQILNEYGASEMELEESSASIARAGDYTDFRTEIPGIPEPSPNRAYDAPRLRDIRKRIDNGSCGIEEIEAIAVDMLPEIAELSSDYLGNTVVQKLFENCSEEVKIKMLIEIAPHLASIGIHKNGTWAAQKIIDVAKTEEQVPTPGAPYFLILILQMKLITESLHEYTPALFLDQFGNYVVQCCLRFGQPHTNFIFESMMEKLWETAQGRFGARAMRACLESHSATKEQQVFFHPYDTSN
jgi:protein JSN1